MQTRREHLASLFACGASLLSARTLRASDDSHTIAFGNGNYGLKMYAPNKAIQFISDTGYDSLEFCLMSGWPTEPTIVSPSQRRDLRKQIGDLGLRVPSLLETLPCVKSDPAVHKANLEKIRRSAQFGHDVNAGVGGVVPCLQTTLGGKSEDWDPLKHLVVEHLHDWAEAGREMHTVVAFKGENLNINDTAERTLWLVQQVNSPWLRVLYDYSHYQASGEQLDKTLDLLLPYTVMVSIKDGKNYPDKPGFERLLPGDGHIDYVEYFRHLVKFGYNGSVVVEISAQLSRADNYDPAYAVKHSYDNIAPIMAKVGVSRPRHQKVVV
jgi:sugar phosphate isomerase/epimerase